ncbi:MAG: hypothetical protein ACOC80_10670 [Petrotogales bacterium]
MKKKIFLSKADIELHNFCSKEKEKEALQHLHITKNSIEVTDGKILLRNTLTKMNEDDFPATPGDQIDFSKDKVLIPMDKAKQIKVPKSKKMPVLNYCCISKNHDGFLAITNDLEKENNVKFESPPLTYPPTDRVFKSTNSHNRLHIKISTKLLRELVKYADKNINSPWPAIDFYFDKNNNTGPIQFNFKIDDNQHCKGILMPMY